MGSIGRYIFSTTIAAFLLILVSLTGTMWVTQSLRHVDLMTSQQQTILTFVGLTGLLVPLLILIIAPVAFLIATIHVLNKLGADSEIIVMNASGMSPWRLFRPLLAASVVTAILVLFISAYLSPKGLREMRVWLTEVRANLVTYIVQPGRFVSLGSGLTFHIRERRVSGQLAGVLLDDQRNPQERVTLIAELGDLVRTNQGTFLVLQNGSAQRYERGRADPTIVLFDRYAFDLSQFDTLPAINHTLSERFLWQLMFPSPEDKLDPGKSNQLRAEVHSRLMAPVYPIVFTIVVYAFLGAPRTTRQSRGMSLLAAIGAAATVRLVGFVSTTVGVKLPILLTVEYVVVILASALGLLAIGKGIIIEPPAFVSNGVTALSERFSKRFGNLVAPAQ